MPAGVGGYMLQGCVIRANTANTGAFLDEILTLLPESWFLQCSQWPRINCHKRVVEGNMILCSDLKAKSVSFIKSKSVSYSSSIHHDI